MGLFSSKYVTQVGTSISRVIEDDTIPQSAKTGSIKAIFNDGNLPDYVMEELVNSIGVRAERMYAYAEDNYVHGLPSGEVFSSTQGRQQVEAVIEAFEGQQVLIEYSRFGPPNTLHIGWMTLVQQYGYNQATNELAVLSAQKGFPVYLKDMQVVVPASQADSFEVGSLEQWGTAASAGYTPERLASTGFLSSLTGPSPVLKSTTAAQVQLLVAYVWEKQTPVLPATVPPRFTASIEEETLTIVPSGFDDEADYFHAKYTFNNQTKYWMYRYGAGTYPTLDSVFVNGPAVSGSYFPFAYFRYNKQSVISNKTTPAYLTSKKLVKFLGIDYDAMAEAIDENPDIADVEQAMLVMAVPAVSTNAVEARYLFEYFDTLHDAMGGGTWSGLTSIASQFSGDAPAKHTIVIQDAQFKMALTNDGIHKKIAAGSIGSVGTHNNSFVSENVVTEFVDPDTGVITTSTTPIKSHVYRRQISTGLYEEITVRNLKMTYFVFENYTTVGDENDDILLIPIDRTVSQNFSIGDREILYSRSLHFVFNSRVVTKVKWYQTGVFKALLFIVAVGMAIYDGGATFGAYLGLTGTAAIVATVVIQLIVGQLLTAAFKLFVKAFGAEVAQAIAVIALLYGGYRVFMNGGSLQGTWASELLQLSSGLQSAALQDKFSDLLEQQDQFNLFVEEQEELLESAQKLLETSNTLSPFVIFGEKPEDFYNRTIHYGNIGTLGITAISSYVDIALTLPTLNDTVGEEIYAA
jgi:hypothetical protein